MLLSGPDEGPKSNKAEEFEFELDYPEFLIFPAAI